MTEASAGAGSFLGTLELFSHLSESEMQELASTALPFKAEADEVLFRQGDAAEEMYCLEEGRVRITVRVAGEDELEVARFGPSSVLGEMALVEPGVRSATARVVEPTRGYRIERWSFEILRAAFRPSSHKTVRRLAELVSARLRATTRELLRSGRAGLTVDRLGPAHDGPDGVRVFEGESPDLDRENLLLLPVFAGFTPTELDEISTHLTPVEVERDGMVFDAGDEPHAAYIVVRGAVESRARTPGGMVKLALWGPGRLLGEEALFSPEPRLARALAREDSLLLELEADRFRALHEGGAVSMYKLCDAAARLLVQALRGANRRSIWYATRDRSDATDGPGTRNPSGNRARSGEGAP